MLFHFILGDLFIHNLNKEGSEILNKKSHDPIIERFTKSEIPKKIAYGVTEHSQGSTMVMGIANLAMATGNVGREGVGVNPLRGQNNVQGACDMGSFPHEFPGYRHVSDSTTRATLEDDVSTSTRGSSQNKPLEPLRIIVRSTSLFEASRLISSYTSFAPSEREVESIGM